ncbi:MAG: SiaB family protein kinase [Bacteroidota bacterium]
MATSTKRVTDIQADYHKSISSVIRPESAELLVFPHFGDFTSNRNEHITEAVSCTDLGKSGNTRQTMKRVVTVLVEMLQNISIHGERDRSEKMNAYVIIAKGKDYFKICTGNMLGVNHAKELMPRVELLVDYDKLDFKSEIRHKLLHDELSKKGGAGLGLLTIAKKAEKGWGYTFSVMPDDMAYFQMCVSVPTVDK